MFESKMMQILLRGGTRQGFGEKQASLIIDDKLR